MFELSVAKKYLIPKKKQLSVTLIALMSVTVISLVVWLVLVFLSVTDGMERTWLQKLTSLNAPLRITPTEAYYSSYYYKIDSLSNKSKFSEKTIAEKKASALSDPYDVSEDSEIPLDWPQPHKVNGKLKDPVKEAFAILENLKKKQSDIVFQDFELSGALLRLNMPRPGISQPTFISQVSYLSSFSGQSPYIKSLLVPPTKEDIDHLYFLAERDGSLMTSLYSNIQNQGSLLSDFKEEPYNAPPWVYSLNGSMQLPMRENKHGILLAKNYQENGVKVGDSGTLSYQSASMASLQEQRIPVYVAGFYDPGVMSIGNKCLLVPPTITQTINSSSNTFAFDKTEANGILVWFKDLGSTAKIKAELDKAFKDAGIDTYWKSTPYYEYDFARDLLEQFQSDKYLFSMLAGIILLVACCNIISLLVLLVNDKKREIGIMQAMGASSRSIAAIFGICGISIGLLSSFIGIAAAKFTLYNIDYIVNFLSFIQGHNAFNPAFYGKTLPNTLSHDALIFVLIATPLISLAAGLVPAIKASRLKPSVILRSE